MRCRRAGREAEKKISIGYYCSGQRSTRHKVQPYVQF